MGFGIAGFPRPPVFSKGVRLIDFDIKLYPKLVSGCVALYIG